MILNTLVGSFIPPLNGQLRDGIDIPMDKLKGLNITNLQIKTELDYVAAGNIHEQFDSSQSLTNQHKDCG
jgi:hypothetical protein